MAEGKGPADLSTLVTVSEHALLTDPEKAVDTAMQQARDGVLFIPNVERFFGGSNVNAEFPKATRAVQRAFLNLRPVVIASTTDLAWNDRLAGDSTVREKSHRLRVSEPTVDETVAILGVHKKRLEDDYAVQIATARCPPPPTWRSATLQAPRCRPPHLRSYTAPVRCSRSRPSPTGAGGDGQGAKADMLLDADDVAWLSAS
jgi:hypothetical protein